MSPSTQEFADTATGLTHEHRLYLIRETATALGINSVLSLLFAGVVAHGKHVVPLWGAGGMAIDFCPQLFMMSFATTLAVTLITRQRLRTGKVSTLHAAPVFIGALPVPRTAWIRAILFGALVVAVFWPPSLLGMWIGHVDALAPLPFLAFKVVYGAVITLLFAPLIILFALRP